MKTPAFPAAMILIASLLTGCVEDGGEPMETVPYVDLEQFMGNWYVVANIPTSIESGAHNALESYALNSDGTVATTFSFNKSSIHRLPRRDTRPRMRSP